jgi:hypothetical protein
MAGSKRVFVFGAGFSKPAGMPLATELLPLLLQELPRKGEMHEWLEVLGEQLAWLSGDCQQPAARKLNIEEVFHYAHFHIELHLLRQHLVRVGRNDGPGTPANAAYSIEAWLSHLEEALGDVIIGKQSSADLAPITRWAEKVRTDDVVLTFNYDNLVELALTNLSRIWNHGTGLAVASVRMRTFNFG